MYVHPPTLHFAVACAEAASGRQAHAILKHDSHTPYACFFNFQ